MSTITIRKYNPDTARYELPDPWAGAPEGVRLIVRENNSFGPPERVVDVCGIAWGKSRHTGEWVTTAQPRGGQTGTVEWYLNGGLLGQLVGQPKPTPTPETTDPWKGAPQGRRFLNRRGERYIVLSGTKIIHGDDGWDSPGRFNGGNYTADYLIRLGWTEVESPSYTPPLDHSIAIVQFRDGAKWFFDGTKQKYYQVGACSHSHPQIMAADAWKKAFESEPEPKVLVSA